MTEKKGMNKQIDEEDKDDEELLLSPNDFAYAMNLKRKMLK